MDFTQQACMMHRGATKLFSKFLKSTTWGINASATTFNTRPQIIKKITNILQILVQWQQRQTRRRSVVSERHILYIDFVSFWAGGSHIPINLLRPDLHKNQKPAGSCKSPSEYKRRGLRAVKGRLVKRQLLFEAVEIHWIFFKCLTTRFWGHVKICI